ncbi:MAG: phosphocholine cytidylyltransferase family protein [Alphaproteobacteria bacterium]|nr:phosphocholine cytidylyltransferase family protein [Alphaproteobacteria bacterium]
MTQARHGIILAAGRGSRMGTATQDQPKCRTLLHGKSLLDWQLDALRAAGLQEIGLVRGYLADSFDQPLHYFDNPRWPETNMVASLACAAAWLNAYPCMVSYSDIVYQPESVKRLLSCEADIAITYDPNWLDLWRLRFDDPLSDAETFRVMNGNVTEIGNRTTREEDIQGQFMGLLRIAPAGWRKIEAFLSRLDPATADRLDVTALLQRLIAGGEAVAGVPIAEPWCEIDSPSDLERYQSAAMWQWTSGQRPC